MAAPILWAHGIFWLFMLENLHVHKIPRFGGPGVFWVLGEGVPILFWWTQGFFWSVNKKVFFSEKGWGIQWIGGSVRISTGQAIQWRGPGQKSAIGTLQKGLVTSNLQFLHRTTQKSPLPNVHLEGVNLRLKLSWGCFIAKGGPQKGWCFRLDIFENPYGAPRPTEPPNLPATKKEIPKNPKTPIIPKSKRSFPKSKRSFPQK